MQVKSLIVPGEDIHVAATLGNARLTLTKEDSNLLIQALRQAYAQPGQSIPTHMASNSRFSCMAIRKADRNELHFLMESDSYVTVFVEDFMHLADEIENALSGETVH